MGAKSSHPRRSADGDPFAGRTININGRPYFFQKRLGAGGFGSVYSAKAPNGMTVAVKVLMLTNIPRPQMEGRVTSFLNEVTLLNRLRQESRHVVVIHDFGFSPQAGQAYIVMELGNETLTKLVTRLRQMDETGGTAVHPEMIKEFWQQMVSIVSTLTRNGIVHMDLKPDNLILFGATLKIADLGISRKTNNAGLGGMGTVPFTAPEIMRDIPGAERFYGPKADVWSLGVILYFMAYGKLPTYHPLAANPPPGQAPYPDRDLVNMLRRTLVVDPRRRADINEVARHPFTRD